MAIDIFAIPKNSELNELSSVMCSYSEQIHDRLFFESGLDFKNLPRLYEMADPYRISEYSGNNLVELVTELDKVLPDFAHDYDVFTSFHCLRNICDAALKVDHKVLIIGD